MSAYQKNNNDATNKKSTRQGAGKFTRHTNKGSSTLGGKVSKTYKKKSRGQGDGRKR